MTIRTYVEFQPSNVVWRISSSVHVCPHTEPETETDRRTDGARAVSSDARKADGCCCGDAMTGSRKLGHWAGQEGSLGLAS